MHEPPENFTRVPGHEDYAVSRTGEVWSCKKGTILYTHINGAGYKSVNGTAVHRLVALTYLPNPENLPTVDHIDKNKLNNSVENLRWATYTDQAKNRSEEHKRKCADVLALAAVQNSKKVNKIDMTTGEILETYESINEAARTNNIPPASIQHCIHGRSKSCHGYFWCLDGEEIKLPEYGSSGERHGKVNMIDPKTKSVIETFESVFQAARYLNKDAKGIYQCAKGKSHIAYGYEWKFVDE